MSGVSRSRSSLSLGTFVVWVGLCGAAHEPAEAPHFAREVRPILADHCFACHGPDASTRQPRSNPLRLDRAAGLNERRDGQRVVDAGSPDRSLLWIRLTAADLAERMPPTSAKHAPSAEELDVLRRWIEAGAPYEDRHWSFEPVAAIDPPASDSAWVANAIDAFLLAGMRAENVSPNPESDPRTLLRRLSFDLRGLPPTPEEVDAFVADPSEAHWSAFVDQWLASTAHAERMATFWLDLVRYADSTGIHADNPWHSAPYRSWVVHAFQQNMPFDRFTREQLAGDLLPDASLDQRVAAAYNRLNLITREGGSQAKEFLVRYTADRVRNAAEVWLALSMGCAECHDHKFDPLTTREFYEFGAFFADIEQVGVYNESSEYEFSPEMPVPSPVQARERDELERSLAALEAEFLGETPERAADRAAFLHRLAEHERAWQTLHPSEIRGAEGTTFQLDDDRWILASGASPDVDRTTLLFAATEGPLAAVQLELRPDPSLPANGPGRANNGNFVLSELEVYAGGERVSVARARSSFDQKDYGVALALDGKGGRAGWAVLGSGGPERRARAVFELTDPIPTGTELALVLVQEHGSRHTLGSFRVRGASTLDGSTLAATQATPDSTSSGATGTIPVLDGAVAAWIANDESPRSAEQDALLANLHRDHSESLAGLRERRRALIDRLEQLEEEIPRVLETRAVEPMTIRVLPRGNWQDESGDVVQPSVPEVLGELPELGRRPTRLDLANWLVSGEHPLTARVMVNRLWRMLFGHGIVRTLDDFGLQGAAPSHPELLDHLAQHFVDSGWNVRALLRQMVTSRAYRQSSRVDPASRVTSATGSDVRASTFAQQATHRLDAEFVRDQALVASGLLVHAIGGPSVKPYQPARYWEHLNFPKREYEPSTGSDLYRRSLYMHWQRQYLHPTLLAFDAPPRDRCVAERDRSNTPQAALVLLNDPIFVEAARVLAQRVLFEGEETDEQRLIRAFRLVLQRTPNGTETSRLQDLLADHRVHFATHPEAAERLLTVGERPRADDLDPAELAAWTSVTRVLLNLHETVTRR